MIPTMRIEQPPMSNLSHLELSSSIICYLYASLNLFFLSFLILISLNFKSLSCKILFSFLLVDTYFFRIDSRFVNVTDRSNGISGSVLRKSAKAI